MPNAHLSILVCVYHFGNRYKKKQRIESSLTPLCTCGALPCWSGRNPCQANNGGCSQLCFPTSENSRSCSCTLGYNLRPDRMSCEGACRLSPALPRGLNARAMRTVVVEQDVVTFRGHTRDVLMFDRDSIWVKSGDVIFETSCSRVCGAGAEGD